MSGNTAEEKIDLKSKIQKSIESISSFSSSSAIKIATGNLDLFSAESPAVCTRSQTSRAPTPIPETTSEPNIPIQKPQPKPPSQPDFKIPDNKEKKKFDMTKKGSRVKTDYQKMSSETPPGPSRSSSSGSLNKEPLEPIGASQSLKQIEKMSDKEMVDHLTKNMPELKDEAMYLYQCPEKIGLEPLRDILLYKIKNWKQSTLVITALVTGIRAGLNYSLRDQHRTYIELFNDMRSVMTESTKMMTDVSQSLHETLKSENKESGKTLASLKEVLGTAHELTKTLVEGKSHGHLQVPSKPTRS